MLEIRHTEKSNPKGIRNAYDVIFDSKGILLRDSFYLWIINLLNPTPGSQLIDIACGEGRLAKLAAQKGLNIIGLDFSYTGVLKASRLTPGISWINCDGERISLRDECTDYVTHIGSLEHFENAQVGANEIGRILKPTGLACIFVPNSFGIWGNIKTVLQTGDIFDDGQPLQRYATRRQWEFIFSKAGLKVKKVYGYNEIEPPATHQDLIWMIKKPQKFIRAFLSPAVPINLSNHFAFICSRV
jgi:ubiquinone/menaquinone biosynthesis C-methylase UbiE